MSAKDRVFRKEVPGLRKEDQLVDCFNKPFQVGVPCFDLDMEDLPTSLRKSSSRGKRKRRFP
jgi:hypothetical protein